MGLPDGTDAEAMEGRDGNSEEEEEEEEVDDKMEEQADVAKVRRALKGPTQRRGRNIRPPICHIAAGASIVCAAGPPIGPTELHNNSKRQTTAAEYPKSPSTTSSWDKQGTEQQNTP